MNSMMLVLTMSAGQGPAGAYPPAPGYYSGVPVVRTQAAGQPPANLPGMLPMAGQPGGMPTQMPPGMAPPATTNGNGNGACPTCEAPKEAEPAPEAPEPWALMRCLKGTAWGDCLDKRRVSFSGWAEGSYTVSNNSVSNQPVVWNDRADKFLLNQVWFRAEKGFDTESKEWSFGWRLDMLYGTDYRFTIPRGFWNNQLENAKGLQNLYGFDPLQHYVAAYLPNVFKGTEIRAGRMYTPFGYESLEAVSSPFVSRSYAFNWCPPFTHYGIMLAPTFNDNWAGKFMIANGNDVMIGDGSGEVRFVGALTWTSTDKKTSATLGTSFGRGSFNANEPFNPATIGLQTEPAGRNNINVFDLLITRQCTEKFSYAIEAIYGYQNGVPANVPGGIIATNKFSGTAHWGSIVQYLNYDFNDKLRGIIRVETFDDFEGQRTGFEGLYTAVTVGAQYKFCKSAILRPEIRYDYNGYRSPFEGKHGLLTAALDLIVRY